MHGENRRKIKPRQRGAYRRWLPKMEELRTVERVNHGRSILTVPPEPYAGPREFVLSGADALGARGSVAQRDVFRVRRDEHVCRPYGGFRIYHRDREIGRSLSWPDYDACRRIRRHNGYAREDEE